MKHAVSSDFYYVVDKSKYYYNLSNGLFDITVEPLSELWGFYDKEFKLPKKESIDSIKDQIGFDKIKLSDHNTMIKSNNQIEISLNAIAKGYAVDKIASYFDNNNVKNYMVEIGGEVKTKGFNSLGQKWKIGLSSFELDVGNVFEYIFINDGAMATSGDYRNFLVYDDTSYSHVINPVTGYPTKNNVVSATVITDNCIDADALATILNIMDPKVKGTRYYSSDELVDKFKDSFMGQIGMRIMQRPQGRKQYKTKEELNAFMAKYFIENVWV